MSVNCPIPKKVFLVAGTRPNFVKIAPILRALHPIPELDGFVVHTGQHYDEDLSESFFQDLSIPRPAFPLHIRGGSHAEQTAQILVAFETVCIREQPDLVLVVGDVNSTLAAALAAKKLHIEVAHVEAGLRSGDRRMPEEINRLATDSISDLFFTTEASGSEHLIREGKPVDRIHRVGNVMIDSLLFQLGQLEEAGPTEETKRFCAQLNAPYFCMTLHRPSNVDDPHSLGKILDAVGELAVEVPIVFPCHPRTRRSIERFGFLDRFVVPGSSPRGIWLCDPMRYDRFLWVYKDAALVLTDSGGIQEETTALQIPCVTLRSTTERPITCSIGSNVLLGEDLDRLPALGASALAGSWKPSRVPELWDGHAAERIVAILHEHLV